GGVRRAPGGGARAGRGGGRRCNPGRRRRPGKAGVPGGVAGAASHSRPPGRRTEPRRGTVRPPRRSIRQLGGTQHSRRPGGTQHSRRPGGAPNCPPTAWLGRFMLLVRSFSEKYLKV